MEYIPFDAKSMHNCTPRLWDFSHYAYRAHEAFFNGKWEGICAFGLPKEAWVKLWHWYTIGFPYSRLGRILRRIIKP